MARKAERKYKESGFLELKISESNMTIWTSKRSISF